MMRWVNELNTTSFRILATVGMMYLTGLRYIASGAGIVKGVHFDEWMPTWEWLVFITVMAGVDSAVLVAKRLTDYKYVAAKQPNINVETANVETQGGDVKVSTAPAKPVEDEAVG